MMRLRYRRRDKPQRRFLASPLLVAVLLLLILSDRSHAYNHPDCDSWPSHETWEEELGSLLSKPSRLHGPFTDQPGQEYAEKCYASEYFLQNDLKWINHGEGLCTFSHVCAAKECGVNEESNLPAYTVEAHTVADIVAALQFATTHDIAVSVKSSGHSYAGQSTYPHSLLIWMRHFRYDGDDDDQGQILKNYETCDGSTVAAALKIRGGATFLEAVDVVGDDYHIVSGECPTVSLSGGWLMGGGMSYTSQMYGLGIDNVLEMTVVLANGDIKTVNDCSSTMNPNEPDLWYALRGGGGGNFGIVISITYRLHEPTKICYLDLNYSPDIQGTVFIDDEQRRIESAWLDFFYSHILNLDRRWGGAHGIVGARLYFVGSEEEARESDFFKGLEDWYANVLTTETFKPSDLGLESPGDLLEEFQSWNDVITSAPDNLSSSLQSGVDIIGDALWIIPQQLFEDDIQAVRKAVLDAANAGVLNKVSFRLGVGYILGGAPLDDQSDTTVVRPLRTGLLAYSAIGAGLDRLKELAPPEKGGGFSFNHMYARSPNYIENFWGQDHYARLLAIKNEVDPNHRFNVYQGVGYRADVAPTCDDIPHPSLGLEWIGRSIIAYIWGLLLTVFDILTS